MDPQPHVRWDFGLLGYNVGETKIGNVPHSEIWRSKRGEEKKKMVKRDNKEIESLRHHRDV